MAQRRTVADTEWTCAICDAVHDRASAPELICPGCASGLRPVESDSRAQRADGVHDDEAYGSAVVVCYCFTALLAYIAGIVTVVGWRWLWS
jgi:hypothetical protein